jgi:hypothetical protein
LEIGFNFANRSPIHRANFGPAISILLIALRVIEHDHIVAQLVNINLPIVVLVQRVVDHFKQLLVFCVRNLRQESLDLFLELRIVARPLTTKLLQNRMQRDGM